MVEIEKVEATEIVVSILGEPITKTMEKIDKNQLRSVVVVDQEFRLVGSVSDGDIRRGLLSGNKLSDKIDIFLNPDPYKITPNANDHRVIALFSNFAISLLPVVDNNGFLLYCLVEKKRTRDFEIDCNAIIMAGGKGSRLANLTSETPKPLLDLGTGQSVLEILIGKLVNSGIRQIYISVNHMADKIIEHIGDGSLWGCRITYLVEESPLGTAGSINLLPNEARGLPLIVLNADLVISDSFGSLIEQHIKSKKDISVVTTEYGVQVPYGVVGANFTIKEKPYFKYDILCGIYIFSRLPEVPRTISQMNMNELLSDCGALGMVFNEIKLKEDWVDIGTIENFVDIKKRIQEI